jgi:kynurenine formamidase
MYEIEDWGSAGAVTDHVGVSFHGFTTTHIDAICHVWGPDGMWNGKHPGEVITARGVDYAHVDKLRDGIITRGVLLDVPRYRGTAYVTREDPVTSTELEQVAASQNTPIAPGDALVINCGREAWEAEYDSWCTRTVLRDADGKPEVRMLHAGFHVSCLRFFRESDCSVVVWDMQDEWTEAPGTGLSVHNAIWAYGLTLVDNAQLDPLAATCRELDRYEFLFVAGPLRIAGGTGSPVNPLAIF